MSDLEKPQDMPLESNCVGCSTKLRYVLEPTDGAAPTLRCLDSDCPYRRGHLCNDCAQRVERLFERSRKRYARLSRSNEEVLAEMNKIRKKKSQRTRKRNKRLATWSVTAMPRTAKELSAR